MRLAWILTLSLLLLASGIGLCDPEKRSIFYAAPDLVAGDTIERDTVNRNSLYALPVLFYTPETGLGFGVAGVYAFHLRNDSLSARPSSVQMVAAYTLQKQLLVYFPYTLFLKNGDYYSYGELGYYRYVYQFFGIGNEVDPNFEEAYSVNFPRIRITALKRVSPAVYVGFRYWFEDFQIAETDEEGELVTTQVAGLAMI